MKIISCHVENFGVLSNIDFNFEDGLNVTLRENGWGKSTLAAFIKAMFYGLEGDGKRDEFSNERKRFAPWQGGAFGGSMKIDVAGKTYIVSRIFGSKVQEDEFELRDASTNLVSLDYSEKIGEELFHINGESFLRTIFIKQNDCFNAGTTDDINAKLGNISDGLDLNKFALADTALKDALNAYSATRKTGELYKMASEISELKVKTQEIPSYENVVSEVEARIHDTKLEIESVKKELSSINEERKKAAKKEVLRKDKAAYLSLIQDVKKKEEELQVRRNFFKGDIPSEEICKDWEDTARIIERESATYEATKLYDAEVDLYTSYVEAFKDGLPKEEDIKEKADEAKELQKLRSLGERFALSKEDEDKLKSYRERFGNIDEAENEVSEAIEKWGERGRLVSEEKMLSKELSDKEYSLSDINQKQKSKKAGLVVLGLLCILAGGFAEVYAFVINKNAGNIAVIAGAVLLLAGLFFVIASAFKGARRNGEVLSADVENIQAKLDNVTAVLNETEHYVKVLCEENRIAYNEAEVTKILNDLSRELYDYRSVLTKASEASANDYTKKCNEMSEDIREFLEGFGVYALEEEYVAKLSELARNAKHFESLDIKAKENAASKHKRDQLTERLELSMKAYQFDIFGDVAKKADEILDVLTEYNSILEILNEFKGRLAKFESEHDVEALMGLSEEENDVSLDIVNTRENELNVRLENLTDSLATDLRTVDTYSAKLEELSDLKEELTALEEELREKKVRYEYIKKAEAYLTGAKERLTARYMEPLLNGFRKYYSTLTGEDASSYKIDANTVITKEEKGKQRSTQSLSYGYRDLVGFCMRLSVADAMYEGEKPVLILDDPFVNLDDKKTAGAAKVLKEAAKDYQILYLTCREDRL